MEDKMDGGKILIADDEPAVRSLVCSMLEKDYSVIGASNGKEAINIARMQKPDLILMDIMMPKVDGYIACYAIKSDPELKNIPVVMLTGIGHELNMKLSRQFGADGYLTKPFKLQDLMEVIVKFLPIT
jgi:CheY-like chemotaxis protein